MRSFVYLLLLGSFTGLNTVACLAQQAGPRTLENLLNSDEGQKPAAAKEVDAGPKRPAGTVARPKGGVQHPDLDKAWADYDAAVTKAAEGIRAAINKHFDAATATGDLDEAERWQAALEKFEKTGEVPTEKEAKAAVSAAVTAYKKAKEELTKAYEDVVKALTMEKRIAEAKAARDELQAADKAPPTDSKPNPVPEKRGVAQDRGRNNRETDAKQKVLAKFIGLYRNADNGNMEEIRTDGLFTVNGNMSNQWSGKWFVDMNDPKGPCVVRESINNTTSRWYIHANDPDTIVSHNGVKLRKVR